MLSTLLELYKCPKFLRAAVELSAQVSISNIDLSVFSLTCALNGLSGRNS